MDRHCDRCDRTWTGREGDRCRECYGSKRKADEQTPEFWRKVWAE